jgi:dihydrofolate reductase
MVDFITSLDGYGAAEGWPGWWGMESPEYLGWLGEQPEHTVLMGATTYRLMAEFAASGEEGVDQLDPMSKVVFSSTLSEPLAWANTRLVTGDAVEAVRAMKEDSHIEMRTLGSVGLCRSLITAELVDRFRVVVFPVVTVQPAKIGSMTDIPTSGSTWSRAAPSTEGSNCWSTFPPCSTVRRVPREQRAE